MIDTANTGKACLCHTTTDELIASQLADRLRIAGLSVTQRCVDETSARSTRTRAQELAPFDWMIVLVSPTSTESPVIHAEVGAALQLVWRGKLHDVIPIIVTPIDIAKIPPLWATLQYYDASRNLDDVLGSLMQALTLYSPASLGRSQHGHRHMHGHAKGTQRLSRRRLLRLGLAVASASVIAAGVDVSWQARSLIERKLQPHAALSPAAVAPTPISSPTPVQGNLMWRQQTGQMVSTTGCISGNRLFARGDGGTLFALSTDDGTVQWRYHSVGGDMTTPVTHGELVIVAEPQTETAFLVSALHSISGRVSWRRTFPSTNYFTTSPNQLAISSSVLYCLSYPQLCAMEAESGNVLWTALNGDDCFALAATSDRLYCHLWSNDIDRNLIALRPSDGSVVWRALVKSNISCIAPVIVGSTVIATTNQGLTAVRQSDGLVLWSRTDVAPAGNPAVSADTLLVGSAVGLGVGSTGTFYALDLTYGYITWSFDARGGVYSSPAVHKGVVYFGSENGSIYGLRISDGTLVWQYTTQGPVEAGPVISNGVMYVGSKDGSVYAFQL